MKLEHKHLALTLKADGEDGTIEGYGAVFGNIDSGNDLVLPGAFAKSIARMAAANDNPRMLWQHKTDMPIGVWDEVKETPEGLYLKGRILLDTDMGRNAYALLKGGAIKGLSIGYSTKDYSIDRKTGTRLLKELDLFEVSPVTFPMNRLAGITRVKGACEDVGTAAQLVAAALGACQAAGEDTAPEVLAGMQQMLTAALGLLADPPEDDDTNSPDAGSEGMGKSRPQTIRQFEEYLREGGFSQKDATTVALHGFKALTTQGEPDQEVTPAAKLAALFNQFTA